jgi:hypothetical protein
VARAARPPEAAKSGKNSCFASAAKPPTERTATRSLNLWFCVGVSDIHQCPRCELRFLSRTELVDHIAECHPGELDDDTVEFD